jgi:hypothetical protein
MSDTDDRLFGMPFKYDFIVCPSPLICSFVVINQFWTKLTVKIVPILRRSLYPVFICFIFLCSAHEKCKNSHRGIDVDHGINLDQHSKLRNECKCSILYLNLFRGFEYWSTLITWSTLIPRWEYLARGA